jgi:GTPase SAR1 family protein
VKESVEKLLKVARTHSLLQNEKGSWKRTKVFLLGDSGAGKTSILRWLQGRPFEEKHISTDGVDMVTADMKDWKEVTIDPKQLIVDALKFKSKEDLTPNPKVESKGESNIPPKNIKKGDKIISDSQLEYNQRLENPMLKLSEGLKIESQSDKATRKLVYSIDPSLITEDLINSVKNYDQDKRKNEVPLTFDIWDFGGQEVYYNTHQFFLTSNAIYLLAVNIHQKDEEYQLKRIVFWIHSILTYAPNASILIIGTHQDLANNSEERMKKIWQTACNYIPNLPNNYCFSISCKEASKLISPIKSNLLKGIEISR